MLTFKKGNNKIQFAWAGTLIDPTSLRIRFLDHKKRLDLLDTTYPPNRNDALQWNIFSKYSGPVAVEINYFTSGITWKANYVVLTNQREDKMAITGYVKVVNNSGEDYPDANVRLVVGTIHLVERIRDLAGGSWKYRNGKEDEKMEARRRFKKSVGRAEMLHSANGAPGMARPKKIIKEGLSEYFLFTIEGTESVPHRWEKRMRSLYVENVPLKVIYRLSDKKTYSHVHKYYEFKNKKYLGKKGQGQLGESPLPDGNVRIFSQRNKNLSYMGSVNIKYIATGDKVKLNVGASSDVKIKRVLKEYKRTNILVRMNYYRKPYIKKYLVKYYYETTIINTLAFPVLVEIERSFSGEYKLVNMQFKTEKIDKKSFRYYPDVFQNSKKIFQYQVNIKRGSWD